MGLRVGGANGEPVSVGGERVFERTVLLSGVSTFAFIRRTSGIELYPLFVLSNDL
jgi:hypothetical protein